VSYEEVVKVFLDDLGVRPEDIFDEFSKEPLASASIAQVHKAKLKGSGVEVAVKVQKPAIRKQMEWDLFSYRSLMWLAERIFDMPSELSRIANEAGGHDREINGSPQAATFDATLIGGVIQADLQCTLCELSSRHICKPGVLVVHTSFALL
jgi:hypothetical protein